jgi:hypothetical protein
MRWTIAICALLGFAALQDATPRIHKQGVLGIRPDFAGDLDEGRLGFGGDSFDPGKETLVLLDDWENESPLHENGYFKGSDFWFEWGKRMFLRPQHGAKFSKRIVGSANYKACADAIYSRNALRVDNLPVGTNVCMRTSEGRLANITIHGYDPATFAFTVTYVTWEK